MSHQNEKIFEYFAISLRELQMIIVDEMAPRDRCLFARCSKLSWKQAKSSKHAIYGLQLDGWWRSWVANINVSFSEETKKDGFRLVFIQRRGGNHMKYQKLNEVSISWEDAWRMELDNSENVVQIAIDHFRTLLKRYQNTIKMLKITGGRNTETVFEIDSFKNLEKLHIVSDFDIRQVLPKIQRQLKVLEVDGDENCQIIGEWEPMYQVPDSLELHRSNLNYSQFLRINAKTVRVAVGQLTEQNIAHFLESWHNRTYFGKIESCEWRFYDSYFDIDYIFQIVKGFEGTTERIYDELHLKQKDTEEVAILHCGRRALSFLTLRLHDDEEDEDSDESEDWSDEDFAEMDREMEDLD